ncbi:MAG: hypothetical protein ABIW96_00155 [Polaromonas sp.]
MKKPLCVATNMSANERQTLAVLSLAKTQQVTDLADQEGVSRQFIYRQQHKAALALDQAFAARDADVLFHLPVTQAWLDQLILSLTLICRSSCRGVKELLRDMFGFSVSIGTIHNRLQCAAAQAGAINRAQDLSAIRVGLHDEIFHGSMPVLAGVDAASTYCYLLAAAEHRDGDTWGVHLLDAGLQGLNPDYCIADAGAGLRAGQAAAWGDTPCHGDVFHIQQQCESLANVLARRAKGAVSRRKALDQEMEDAKEIGCGNTLSRELTLARQTEQQATRLAKDVKTLVHWLSHDILALAGPDLAQRLALFDFIVAELRQREHLDSPRIRPVRRALENQRDDLLAFAGVLDVKLAGIAQDCKVSLDLVRNACLLQRKSPLSTSYWQRWNQLHEKLAGKFHGVVDAVVDVMKHIPRASSMVENLNSRLRTYFTLRRQLGTPYLGLLQFFLNHRTYLRSQRPERVGKSPAQLLTGTSHPHWLELLGFTRFQRT